MRAFVLCFAALVLCGCAHSKQPAATVSSAPDNAPLAPGDCITIVSGVGGSAAGEPPSYVLDSSGDISTPQVSKLHLAGLTLQQASEKIEDAYVPKNGNRFFMFALKRCH